MEGRRQKEAQQDLLMEEKQSAFYGDGWVDEWVDGWVDGWIGRRQ
jgi:hypothetical protein